MPRFNDWGLALWEREPGEAGPTGGTPGSAAGETPAATEQGFIDGVAMTGRGKRHEHAVRWEGTGMAAGVSRLKREKGDSVAGAKPDCLWAEGASVPLILSSSGTGTVCGRMECVDGGSIHPPRVKVGPSVRIAMTARTACSPDHLREGITPGAGCLITP